MREMAKLISLRASLAKAGLVPDGKDDRIPLGCASADFALAGGLQRGALHEVFAASGHEAAATGFALGLALRVAHTKHLLWIRTDFSALEQGEISATGLLELGADPARVLLLRVPDPLGALRAAKDALGSPALGAVIAEIPGEPKILDLAATRRLTLAASESGATAFLLRFGADAAPSAAETRWCVRAACSTTNDEDWGNPVFATELVRNRHGGTGPWAMEWSCDDGLFTERPADRGAVVSAAFDGSAAAAMEGASEGRAAAL